MILIRGLNTLGPKVLLHRSFHRAMSSSASYLITPQALQASLSGEINRSSRAPVVLDVSWFMPNSPRDARSEYTKKSIPSAQLLDLDELSSSHELGLKHMMPSPEQFASACGKKLSNLLNTYKIW